LPLDKPAILETAKKTSKVLIVHEDRKTHGIGGEVAAIIAEEAFEHLDGPIVRVATEDTHYAFSPPLEEFILPSVDKIVAKARQLAKY
jgi:2-oxoisovalerate dehydrogenase E1 component beta subunit